MNNIPQTKFVLHYKETSDGIQWEKEFSSKPEADAEAYKIFLNGGISIVVEVEVEEPSVILSLPPEDPTEDADDSA